MEKKKQQTILDMKTLYDLKSKYFFTEDAQNVLTYYQSLCIYTTTLEPILAKFFDRNQSLPAAIFSTGLRGTCNVI